MSNIKNNPQWRKQRPLFSGVLMYFPDALLEVAHCSYKGNEQHNPGQPLHWDRSKSTDEADALMRHLLEAGTVDTDGVRHSAKAAWRALALLQKEIEAEQRKTQPNPQPIYKTYEDDEAMEEPDDFSVDGTIIVTNNYDPEYWGV
jgi:hypothetical protein